MIRAAAVHGDPEVPGVCTGTPGPVEDTGRLYWCSEGAFQGAPALRVAGSLGGPSVHLRRRQVCGEGRCVGAWHRTREGEVGRGVGVSESSFRCRSTGGL